MKRDLVESVGRVPRLRSILAGLGVGTALAFAFAPEALAADQHPVLAVEECGAWDPIKPSESCAWQNASSAQRHAQLLDAAYIASLAVAMVAGFVVVK